MQHIYYYLIFFFRPCCSPIIRLRIFQIQTFATCFVGSWSLVLPSHWKPGSIFFLQEHCLFHRPTLLCLLLQFLNSNLVRWNGFDHVQHYLHKSSCLYLWIVWEKLWWKKVVEYSRAVQDDKKEFTFVEESQFFLAFWCILGLDSVLLRILPSFCPQLKPILRRQPWNAFFWIFHLPMCCGCCQLPASCFLTLLELSSTIIHLIIFGSFIVLQSCLSFIGCSIKKPKQNASSYFSCLEVSKCVAYYTSVHMSSIASLHLDGLC